MCILIIRKRLSYFLVKVQQRLDDTTITAEAKYSINFTRSRRKFCLELHYNESKSLLFVTTTKIDHFKTKDSEIKPCLMCLGNISIDCAVNNMKK